MSNFKQISIRKAQALHEAGVTVCYRFPHWPAHEYRPMSEVFYPPENTPSKLYRNYTPKSTKGVAHGTPTFHVEVE